MFRKRWLLAWNQEKGRCICYSTRLSSGSESATEMSLLGKSEEYHPCKRADTVKNANTLKRCEKQIWSIQSKGIFVAVDDVVSNSAGSEVFTPFYHSFPALLKLLQNC